MLIMCLPYGFRCAAHAGSRGRERLDQPGVPPAAREPAHRDAPDPAPRADARCRSVRPPDEAARSPPAGASLGRDPLVLAASRRLGLPRVLTLADAARESWVLNPGGCGGRAALEQTLARVGAPLRVAVETYGLELQLSLVARGVGLGLLP